MWYSTVLLCATVTWQTLAVLASVFMVYERARAPVRRYAPVKSLACNLLVLVHVCAVFIFLGLDKDGPLEGVLRCHGFNVWLFGLVPRFAWLAFLLYDVSFLLAASKNRASIRHVGIALLITCIALSFAATNFFDATAADYQQQQRQPLVA